MATTRTIKFKRTSGSILPENPLEAGELAYIEGSKTLVIGTDTNATTHSLVLDGSIIEVNSVGKPTGIKLKKTESNSDPTFSLSASTIDNSYTLSLPTVNPTDNNNTILVNVSGVMSYGSASAGTLAEVGDVGDGETDLLLNQEILIYNDENSKWATLPASTVNDDLGLGLDDNVEYNDVKVNGILDVDGGGTIFSGSGNIPIVTVRDRIISLGIPGEMVSGTYTVTNGVVMVTTVHPISGSINDAIWIDADSEQIPAGVYSLQPGGDWEGGAVNNVTYYTGSSHGSNIISGGPTGGYFPISQQGQTVTAPSGPGAQTGFTFVVDQGSTNQGSLFNYGARNHGPQTRTISINEEDASGVQRDFSLTWSTTFNANGSWTDNSVQMTIVETLAEERLDGVTDPNFYGGYGPNWNDESRQYYVALETAQTYAWYIDEDVGETIKGRRTFNSINKYPNSYGTPNNHSSGPTPTHNTASYGFVTGWAAASGGSIADGWASIYWLEVNDWDADNATTFSFNLGDNSITGLAGSLTYGNGTITDAGASGGGIIIPGEDQKKLQWINNKGWEFKGGDLRIDSGGTKNTALYVDGDNGSGGQKVLEVDVEKTIVLDTTDPVADNQIKEEAAKLLHNYIDDSVHGIGDKIQVGRLSSDFEITPDTIIGDFDFGGDL
jgi:hypothetical protein